jgi:hypothetical protein
VIVVPIDYSVDVAISRELGAETVGGHLNRRAGSPAPDGTGEHALRSVGQAVSAA